MLNVLNITSILSNCSAFFGYTVHFSIFLSEHRSIPLVLTFRCATSRTDTYDCFFSHTLEMYSHWCQKCPLSRRTQPFAQWKGLVEVLLPEAHWIDINSQ